MTDIDYFGALGVSEPQTTDAETGAGEKEQEVADPAENAEAQSTHEANEKGEKERESADPASQSENNTQQAEPQAGTTQQQHQSEETAEGNTTTQSAEENRAYAAARRKAEAERDAAIAKARQDAKAEADRRVRDLIKRMHIKNPFGAGEIETPEDYEKYAEQSAEEQKRELLVRSGMNEADFDRIVNDLPQVRAAQKAMEQAKTAENAANAEKAKLAMQEELSKITAISPEIQSMQDLGKIQNYGQFYDMVKRGYSMSDAYKIAEFDRIQEKRAAQSRQQAFNAAQSKEHLAATKTRGHGAVSVPKDVREMYRAIMPGITDAEIQSHYGRSKND